MEEFHIPLKALLLAILIATIWLIIWLALLYNAFASLQSTLEKFKDATNFLRTVLLAL